MTARCVVVIKAMQSPEVAIEAPLYESTAEAEKCSALEAGVEEMGVEAAALIISGPIRNYIIIVFLVCGGWRREMGA